MTTQQPASSSSSNGEKINNINVIELKETVDRIASYNGVEIVQILNTSGDILAECINTNNNQNNNNNINNNGIRSPVATPSSKNTAFGNDFSNDTLTATSNHSEGPSVVNMMFPNISTSTASSAQLLLRTAQQYVQNFKTEMDNDDDEITFLQIRSKHGYELMIAPHFGYALVVVKMMA